MTLVEAAANEGMVLAYREGEHMHVDAQGQTRKFLIKHKVEFSSERKRMTIVLENADEDEDCVYVYCKGAD